MGCPDKGIEKQGCGSAMIKTPAKAQEIIRAAKEGGVREDGTRLPVSVKTRIGYNKNELETWMPALLEAGPAVITIHARTRKEMSKVPARWEHLARAVEIRDEFFAKKGGAEKSGSGIAKESVDSAAADTTKDKTLILGNGDVLSIQDGYEKCKATRADGAMLGRAIFGNPWLFKDLDKSNEQIGESGQRFITYEPTLHEKLNVMVEHTREFEKHLGDIKNFAIMKKHYKAYIQGFNGAKELRMELMEKATNAQGVAEIVDKFIEVV
jgi:tRNA-dihydrouridine synthase